MVVAGVADELALEEGDVDDRRVEVDELEDEHFERQVVVEVRLRSVHLWNKSIFPSIIRFVIECNIKTKVHPPHLVRRSAMCS